MAKPRLAPAARDDLKDIRIHSKAAFGVAKTLAYFQGIEATFALLQERPFVGTSEDDLGDGIRSFGFQSHRIYYQVDDGRVLVIRVLHHARDIPSAVKRTQ